MKRDGHIPRHSAKSWALLRLKAAARRALGVVSLGAAAYACDGNTAEPTRGSPRDGGTDSGRTPLPLPPIPSCTPDFESIRSTIIVPTCALPLCHVGSDAFFELLPGEPSTTLIGVPAQCAGWTRVVPGDPDRSYLWRKLTDDDPECGDRMPWGYERLPDHALECIRGWIESL